MFKSVRENLGEAARPLLQSTDRITAALVLVAVAISVLALAVIASAH